MSEPITNVADAVRELGALPVPTGVDADRAKAPWGRGEDDRPLLPMGAHWTDIPELVDQEVARIRARVEQAQPGHWYMAPATEMGLAPGTVRTRVDGYQRTVGQFTNVLPADLELVLHAHADLSWCLDMVAKLRARVAEFEAERQTTNEVLDDATQALRQFREDGVYPQGTAQRVQQRQDDDPARCLSVHEFSPRDGWRMVCGNCDHGKDAECHREGGA